MNRYRLGLAAMLLAFGCGLSQASAETIAVFTKSQNSPIFV
jgi:hypothetical protein